MGIAVVEAFGIGLILGDPFGKPYRHRDPGDRIRDQHIGKAAHHILAALLLIAEYLEPPRRHLAPELQGFLQGDDVDIFVGDHIAQPVVGAAQHVIEILRPDLNLVVEKIGRAVGVILGILDNEFDF